MADVVEINEIEGLEPYRLAWNALHAQTPRASFFHTFDWLKTYWEHFGSEQRLRVLIIRSEGKPIGIVPLCVQREQYHFGSVRVLTYPLSDWGMWYGPIGPNISASLFMAMKHLRETPRDWDMIDLRWIPSESNPSDLGSGNPTVRAMQAAGWPARRSDYQQTSIVRLENSDWETYRARLSKKWRHELGRQQRGLERDFELQFERHRPAGANYGDSEPRWDSYEDCLAIAEQSWQGNSTTGNTLSHNHVRNFLRASHEIAAKLGMLDMVVLKLDGQPVAFQYNYHCNGKLFGLRMGYDRAFAKHGVGKALMGWMLEDSFARGDLQLDMGVGDYAFKQQFRTGTETSSRYSYYPLPAWRGQSVRMSRWIKSRWNTDEAKTTK